LDFTPDLARLTAREITLLFQLANVPVSGDDHIHSLTIESMIPLDNILRGCLNMVPSRTYGH
jgi:hypothetical protein